MVIDIQTEADDIDVSRGGNDLLFAMLREAFPDSLIADEGDDEHFELVVSGTVHDVVVYSQWGNLDFLNWEDVLCDGLVVRADRYRVGGAEPESRHEWNLDELLRRNPSCATMLSDWGLGVGYWPVLMNRHAPAIRVLAGVVDDIRGLHD